jgi:hypothetical protein
MNSFYGSELGLSNYFIFRCDRNSSVSNSCKGGGVLIANRDETTYNLMPVTINNVEYVLVRFATNNVTFAVSSVYIPPIRHIHIYESFMCTVQATISINTDCEFLFRGDFNISD